MTLKEALTQMKQSSAEMAVRAQVGPAVCCLVGAGELGAGTGRWCIGPEWMAYV